MIAAQRNKAKGAAVAEMKARGLDYDQRMAELEDIRAPEPLAEVLQPMFEVYRQTNPWVAEHPLRPKSVVRDLWERAMDFGDFVRFYELARSEGTVLRYLSNAYKTLDRTVPEDRKTDELRDLIEWLGELVRQVDSSLLDEWEALRNPDPETEARPRSAGALDDRPPPVTANRRAFTILVRNALFQRVEHVAHRQWHELEALDGDDGWDAQRWFDALAPFFDEHGVLGTGADARNPALLLIDETPSAAAPGRSWRVEQILADPEQHHDWRIIATVDLDASDAEGTAVVRAEQVGSISGAR